MYAIRSYYDKLFKKLKDKKNNLKHKLKDIEDKKEKRDIKKQLEVIDYILNK